MLFSAPARHATQPPFFVASASVVSESGTTVTVTKPSGTVESDVMVAFLWCRGNHTVSTPPSGWTLEHDTNPTIESSTRRLYCYTKVAVASEGANYAWTMSSSGSTTDPQLGAILTYRACNQTVPDVKGEDNLISGATTSHPQATMTTTSVNCMLVYGWGLNRASTNQVQSPTDPTGMTQRIFILGSSSPGHDSGLAIYDEVVQPPAATGSKTLTTTNTCGSSGIRVALAKI